MVRHESVGTRVSSGLIAALLAFAIPSLAQTQTPLPAWAKTDPPEPTALVVDFLVQQDAAPASNPAALAAQAGVKVQEIATILASGKAVTAALRIVDRDLRPSTNRIDDALFQYHRRRQEVSDAEMSKLKAQIPPGAWKSFVTFVIDATAAREKAIRSANDIKPLAPGAPGGPQK